MGNNTLKKVQGLFNSSGRKRLISNFFSLSILQGFTYILPLLTVPYLVKVLGVEVFGKIAYAQSFIVFFNTLVDYGFNLSATREISIHRKDKQKVTEIFSSIILIKAIFLAISFIIMNAIIFTFDRFSSDIILYYLTFLWVVGQALFPIWYFQGMERMKYITVINILSKIIFTSTIFIFVKNSEHYLLVPLFNGLGFVIGGIVSLFIIYYKFDQKLDLSQREIKKHLKQGFHIFISISSSTVLSSMPVLLIGTFINYEMVGYYSAFEKLAGAIKSFYYIINQTFFPRLSKIYSENIEVYKSYWKKLSLYTIGLSIIVYIILYFTSHIFIKLYYGENFIEYIYIFHILSFSTILYTIINALGLNGLLVVGKHKELSISQLIPAVLLLVSAPVIIKSLGLTAFVVSLLLGDLIIIFIRIYFFRGEIFGES